MYRVLNRSRLINSNIRIPIQYNNIPLSIHYSRKRKDALKPTPLLATLPVTEMGDSTLPGILAFNESILYKIHETGLPWWATIVVSAVALRSSLTFPIALYQQRSLGKMLQLAPMIQSWGETLKAQIGKESSQKGWSYQQYNAELQKRYKKKVNTIYAHHGCARWQLLLLPWIQIPLFISMSLTLRHMSNFPLPWFGQTSGSAISGFSEGGIAWFTDLTATDSTMIIPFLIGAGNLINVELNAWYARGNQSKTQKVLTNTFRVLSVAFVPIAANAPMAIGLYWISSAWYSVLQNIAFKIPSVRNALKLPLLPKKHKLKENL